MEYYIGVALSYSSTVESGIAVIDSNNKIILLDKIFSMQDVIHFFENFSSLKYSNICVSLPWDNSMLNGKWRIFSKPYQFINLCKNFGNANNWMQRYSTRGHDFFSNLSTNNINVKRFEIYLARQNLKLSSYFKERTPADCKFLQNALRSEYKFEDIPFNMMPMAQMEAIVGAILIRESVKNPENSKKIFKFNGMDVINVK